MLSYLAFADEFVKIAKALTNAQKADMHHRSDAKDWSMFENELNSKGFQKAVTKHELTDEKLKKYVESYGAYLLSKKVVGKVPSRTGPHHHEIRKIPGGRLGCGCRDWQYKGSWSGKDCHHIRTLNKEKTSSVVNSAAHALWGAAVTDSVLTNHLQGKGAKRYAKQVSPKDNILKRIDRVLTRRYLD
jgi:hypothetical protein